MSRTLDRTQAKFDKMPSVGADPVVESGSNADGEWTRWADGTQQCYIDVNVTDQAIDTAYGTFYQNTRAWIFPITFIRSPTTTCSLGKWGSSASWGGSAGTSSPISASLRFWDLNSRAAGTTMSISASVIGRWK